MANADDRWDRPTERPPRPDTTPPVVKTATYAAIALFTETDIDGRHPVVKRIDAPTTTELATAVRTLTAQYATGHPDLEILTERIDPDGRSYRLNADVRLATDQANLAHLRTLKQALHERKHHPRPALESEIF